MRWPIATLVAASGGAILGALIGFYSTRNLPLERAERAILGLFIGTLGALLIFVAFSAVVGLLYFFGGPPSWWAVILLSWLFLAAFGGAYAFPGAGLGGRR